MKIREDDGLPTNTRNTGKPEELEEVKLPGTDGIIFLPKKNEPRDEEEANSKKERTSENALTTKGILALTKEELENIANTTTKGKINENIEEKIFNAQLKEIQKVAQLLALMNPDFTKTFPPLTIFQKETIEKVNKLDLIFTHLTKILQSVKEIISKLEKFQEENLVLTPEMQTVATLAKNNLMALLQLISNKNTLDPYELQTFTTNTRSKIISTTQKSNLGNFAISNENLPKNPSRNIEESNTQIREHIMESYRLCKKIESMQENLKDKRGSFNHTKNIIINLKTLFLYIYSTIANTATLLLNTAQTIEKDSRALATLNTNKAVLAFSRNETKAISSHICAKSYQVLKNLYFTLGAEQTAETLNKPESKKKK